MRTEAAPTSAASTREWESALTAADALMLPNIKVRDRPAAAARVTRTALFTTSWPLSRDAPAAAVPRSAP